MRGRGLAVCRGPLLGHGLSAAGGSHDQNPAPAVAPQAMTPAQLAAVSYPARCTGRTHTLYAYQLRRWFTW